MFSKETDITGKRINYRLRTQSDYDNNGVNDSVYVLSHKRLECHGSLSLSLTIPAIQMKIIEYSVIID